MNSIRINKIIIPDLFFKSRVKDSKVNDRIKRIKRGEPLVVTLSHTNEIIDGYAVYMAYKRLGYKYIPFTKQTNIARRNIIIEGEKRICYICGRKLPLEDLTVDHVIPKSMGGSNQEYNLKCCCRLCNTLKGQLTYSDELRNIIRKELVMRGIEIV